MKSIQKLHQSMSIKTSLACVGLDPDISKLPNEFDKSESSVSQFLEEVVDITLPYVSAYKIQKAFFDQFDTGHTMLKEIIQYILFQDATVFVSVDCKIGDIDNTMSAYLHNLFDIIQADAVVINPYMGLEVLEPFFSKYSDKAGIVLVQTSNSGATQVQNLQLANGKLLWEEILNKVVHDWNGAGNIIPVIASTKSANSISIRDIIPDQMPVLYAGYGAQGGSLNSLSSLLNSNNSGVFVNSSRGILYPYQIEDKNWRDKVESAVITLKNDLNSARGVL